MPRLQIRDVKEELDSLIEKCGQNNSETVQKLNQIKNSLYVLAVVQIGLVAHMLFGILTR